MKCDCPVLIPAAFRLVRVPATIEISAAQRKIGTIIAALGSAFSIALSEVIPRAETGISISSKAEWNAVVVINSLLIDLPEALVFIALALLALECVEFADIYIDPNSSVLPLQLDETVD